MYFDTAVSRMEFDYGDEVVRRVETVGAVLGLTKVETAKQAKALFQEVGSILCFDLIQSRIWRRF